MPYVYVGSAVDFLNETPFFIRRGDELNDELDTYFPSKHKRFMDNVAEYTLKNKCGAGIIDVLAFFEQSMPAGIVFRNGLFYRDSGVDMDDLYYWIAQLADLIPSSYDDLDIAIEKSWK